MFDVEHIIQVGGLLAIGAIVFAESGILLGFFLPGDTLLLTAGVFAGKGDLPILWLLLTIIISAIVGYEVGYSIGKRMGPRLFRRQEGILFREDYIHKTKIFFDKYGLVTVIMARFIAHVRTFVSVIAGASTMNRKKYFINNVIGAILWGAGITLMGYWLGNKVPNIDHFIIPVVIAVLVVVYVVALWGILKSPRRRHHLKKGLKEDWDFFLGRNKT